MKLETFSQDTTYEFIDLAQDHNNDEELTFSDDFDVDAFFSNSELNEDSGTQDVLDDEFADAEFLLTLRNDADEAITTISSNVTAENFAKGAVLATSVFSVLGSIIGSCGVFCAHGLGAVAQAGSSGLTMAGSTGLGMPGFNIDEHGNFHLDGNINSLSQATGISKSDLLSGKFSPEDILVTFFSAFGESMAMMFGVGLVEGIIDTVFDGLMPQAA